jgi:hypothetical protein
MRVFEERTRMLFSERSKTKDRKQKVKALSG